MRSSLGVVSCHLTFGSAPEAFEKARGFGFDAIEWFDCGGTAFSAPGAAERIRALAQECGVASEYHAPYQGRWDLGRLGQAEAAERLREMADKARALGAWRMTVHLGSHAPGVPREAAIESVAAAAAEAVTADVRICFENSTTCHNPTELGVSISDLQRLFDAIGGKPVGWTLDAGHANITGNLFDLLDRFAPRLWSTHLHDTDGVRDGHLAPGLGSIDWDRLLSTLSGLGYTGPLNLEFPETTGAWPAFLRRLREAAGA